MSRTTFTKIIGSALIAGLYAWLLAISYDVASEASLPIGGLFTHKARGAFLGFGILGVVWIWTHRKKKPDEPEVKPLPAWFPAPYLWFPLGLLSLVAYLKLVTTDYSSGAAWAVAWVGMTQPLTDAVAWFAPRIGKVSSELITHGYADRVAIFRHASAVAWPWHLVVFFYFPVGWVLLTNRGRWKWQKKPAWRGQRDWQNNSAFWKALLAIPLMFVIGLPFLFLQPRISFDEKMNTLTSVIHLSDSSLVLDSFLAPIFALYPIGFAVFGGFALIYRWFWLKNQAAGTPKPT